MSQNIILFCFICVRRIYLMNKSIKVLILIIILNLCFITGCASSNKDYNAIKIFDKVEPNSLFVEDFKEDFINSKFYNESYKEMVVQY